jgi:hypothetical protein
MSANKNARICAATSPRLLVEVYADRTGQEATRLPTSSANIIRSPTLRHRISAQGLDQVSG